MARLEIIGPEFLKGAKLSQRRQRTKEILEKLSQEFNVPIPKVKFAPYRGRLGRYRFSPKRNLYQITFTSAKLPTNAPSWEHVVRHEFYHHLQTIRNDFQSEREAEKFAKRIIERV